MSAAEAIEACAALNERRAKDCEDDAERWAKSPEPEDRRWAAEQKRQAKALRSLAKLMRDRDIIPVTP
jgi:intergrase/recombinase